MITPCVAATTGHRRRLSLLGSVPKLLFYFPAILCLARGQNLLLPAILQTSISCDKSDFVLKIRFNATFSGLIYTEKGTPNCIYADGAVQPRSFYVLKIPLTGCETRHNDEGNYENEIVVQAGRTFQAGQGDKRFLLTCIPAQPKSSQVTVNFGGVTIDSAVSTTTATVTAAPASIKYEVAVLDGILPDSPVLKRPLAVGDRVSYSVRVITPGTSARLGRCWATDGKSSLELADESGCSLQIAGDVWTDFRVSRKPPDTTLFLNHIKAWAFPTSNEVNIFCNLHVCRSCMQTECERTKKRTAKTRRAAFSSASEALAAAASDADAVLAVRASFRLRRESESKKAEMTPETTAAPQQQHHTVVSHQRSTTIIIPDEATVLNYNEQEEPSSASQIHSVFSLLCVLLILLNNIGPST